ncbi:purine permease 21 [Quercus suber]|uniref:Purine permease 21 n=1 Tax=Quercus suber TaxID=58331 RepID=A0AAW0KJ01_QUESU
MKLPGLRHYKWWLCVAAYSFLVAGQTTATLLGRLYYDQGGNSKWMETFVQSAGFPILLPLLFFFSPSLRSTPSTPLNTSSMKSPPFYTLAFLSLNTSSMKSPPFYTLAFLYLAALLAVNTDSENMIGVPKGKYNNKDETFSAVLDMQIYASIFATCCCLEGLFASGEWKLLGKEVENYGKGRVSYMMTLIWAAVTCQISSIGMLGLIFEVSSLFSNVISTLALPIVPILAVILFHDKMDGVKVMALLLAIWGFFHTFINTISMTLNPRLTKPVLMRLPGQGPS